MLGCCGAPAAWAGRDDLFQQVLERFVHRWEEMSQPRIILACPTCSLMFKKSLPALPTLSLWKCWMKKAYPMIRHAGEVKSWPYTMPAPRGAPRRSRTAYGTSYENSAIRSKNSRTVAV